MATRRTAHLEQGEGGARSGKAKGSHLDQGREGGARSKARGSHLDQGNEGGANASRPTGSHLDPHPGLQDARGSERGGGTPRGHDRINPGLGRDKAGNHLRTRFTRTKKS